MMNTSEQNISRKSLVSKIKENPRHYFAPLLSFIAPGVGQLFVGYPKRFAWQYSLILTFVFLTEYQDLSNYLSGELLTLAEFPMFLVVLGFEVFSIIEAIKLAKSPKSLIPSPFNILICFTLSVAVLVLRFYGTA